MDLKSGMVAGMNVAGFQGRTWRRSAAGVWTNAPGAGGELLVNGNMETGDPPANWLIDSGIPSSVADERTGGAGIAAMKILRGGYAGTLYQTITTVVGTWYTGSLWVKSFDGGYSGIDFRGTSPIYNIVTNSGTWTLLTITTRAIETFIKFYLRCGDIPGNESRFDDASFRARTAADLFATRPCSLTTTISGNLTIADGSQAGLVAHLDNPLDPKYYVHVRHNRTNIFMDIVLDGTPTTLIDTAAPYADLRKAEIRWTDPVTAQLWYNGAQVGTDKDVMLVGAGKWGGYFLPDELSSITE